MDSARGALKPNLRITETESGNYCTQVLLPRAWTFQPGGGIEFDPEANTIYRFLRIGSDVT